MTTLTRLGAIQQMLESNPNMKISDWERETGFSRQQIYRWRDGTSGSPLPSSVKRFASAIQVEVLWESPSRRKCELINKQTEEKDTDMNVSAESVRVTSFLLDQVDTLRQEITELKMNKVQYQPHPEAFDEMAEGLENITKQWNWMFYSTSKPMSCSRDGTVRAINSALEEAIGWSEQELRGSSILDLVHEDDKKSVMRALAQKDRDLIVRIKKKNGNHCTMHVNAKEFGVNGKKYSVGLLTCVEKGCSDCGAES